MLEDHADAAAQRLQFALAQRRDLAAVDLDGAAVGPFEPVEAADQRRLAGAAAADQAEHLAAPHAERHAVERHGGAETLADGFELGDELRGVDRLPRRQWSVQRRYPPTA